MVVNPRVSSTEDVVLGESVIDVVAICYTDFDRIWILSWDSVDGGESEEKKEEREDWMIHDFES